MTRTTSEAYFENLCADLGICLKRIPETINNKTPDYELIIDGQIIITEVKEMTPNKDEQESERVLHERGYGDVLSTTPGNRVRKKISDSSPQIKARAKGIYPSLLVLFDRGFVANHLDPYCIRVAMYGLEQVQIAVPIDPAISPYATGMSYGPKRKMTEEHNTSISAIGVLFATEPDTIVLHVYHNKYAAVSLESRLLSIHGIRQFKIEDELSGKTEKWEQIIQKGCPNLSLHQIFRHGELYVGQIIFTKIRRMII